MDVITKVKITMGKGNVIPVGTRKSKEFFGASADYLLERGSLGVAPPEPPKPDGDTGEGDAAGQKEPPKPEERKGKGVL